MASQVSSTSSTNKYPDDWSERRQRILQRDDYECQQCNSQNPESLHVHHRQPLSKGGTNETSNLVTLCKECHSKKHPNNALLSSESKQTQRKSIHHDFRKQLCKEYGIDYETAKKYDYLHKELLSKRLY